MIFEAVLVWHFAEETDVSFTGPNFFPTLIKLISRYFRRNLKRIERVSTRRRRNIKLFQCNGFFLLLVRKAKKHMTTFVLCLFKALNQDMNSD